MELTAKMVLLALLGLMARTENLDPPELMAQRDLLGTRLVFLYL
jgi:hypothetical protein